LPQIIEDCIDIIHFLAFQSNNIVYPSEATKQEIEILIKNTRISLLNIKKIMVYKIFILLCYN